MSENNSGWIAVSERLPEPCVPVLAAFVNDYGNKRVVRAMYAAPLTLEAHEDQPADWCDQTEEGECFAPEGWYESNEYEETHWRIHEPVTHWQSLPRHPDTTRTDE